MIGAPRGQCLSYILGTVTHPVLYNPLSIFSWVGINNHQFMFPMINHTYLGVGLTIVFAEDSTGIVDIIGSGHLYIIWSLAFGRVALVETQALILGTA